MIHIKSLILGLFIIRVAADPQWEIRMEGATGASTAYEEGRHGTAASRAGSRGGS